jgi:IS30 family transposase
MTTPAQVAERRAKVRQLAKGGASSREIAKEVGVSKDTVLRDMRQADATPDPRAVLRAEKLAHAEEAVSQASAAVQAVIDARPSHMITDDATAQRWCGALRAAADALAAQADAFAEYYPCATA